MAVATVKGAAGLAKLVGLAELVPAVSTVARILQQIAENNVRLDAAAQQAFAETVWATAEKSSSAMKEVLKHFGRAADDAQASGNAAIFELFDALDRHQLPPALRARLMEQAMVGRQQIEKERVSWEGVLTLLGAGSTAALLLVGAIAQGYKYMRKPTFVEGVRGRKL